MTFIEKTLKKKMETENVRKELKISQSIWKMLWCIENVNINLQLKLHVPKIICLRVVPKTKIDFFDKRFCDFFLNFSFVFHCAFEHYWKVPTGFTFLLEKILLKII